MERRWRAVCKSENEKVANGNDDDKPTVSTSLPNDSEFSEAFTNRRKRLFYCFINNVLIQIKIYVVFSYFLHVNMINVKYVKKRIIYSVFGRC